MPDSTEETRQIAPGPAGPYYSRLTDEDREIYDSTTDDLDLGYEIRIIRVALVKLSTEISGDYRTMTAVFNALVRAVTVQATKLADATKAEEETGQVSDQVLLSLRGVSK